ncbi:hypothetical protein PHLCEN_2v6893 [Hermanssonia centrifuga]|uniref:Uncharacterized protein n=1 Tax=Hermanssonia centrifuga TaxID=98765 RepID=A0A2R6NY57_9APHY|nr:hypothetical protein PHLCEN_2v6893 [Hermanssonia centrifuga]
MHYYNSASLEVQQKVSHLAVLAKSLLPSSDDSALVSSRLSSILYYSRPSIPFSRGGGGDDDDDEGEEEGEDHDDGRIAKGQPTAGLAKIRMAAILANTHSHTWARNVVPAYMYAVGDIGYVPRAGGEDVTSFVVLSNVFTAPDAERFDRRGNACLGVSESAHGWQRYLQGAFQEQKLQPFALPQNAVSGWPIVLSAGTRQNVQLVHERSFTSVSAAWKVLLEHAKPIATSHGLEPQDLMLITRAGIDQRFVVHDLRSPPPPLHNPHFHSPHHHRPGFPQHQHQQMMHGYGAGGHRPPGFSGFGAPAPPALFYLFTSPEQGFEPYISETPMYVPVPEGTKRPDVRQCLCGMEG